MDQAGRRGTAGFGRLRWLGMDPEGSRRLALGGGWARGSREIGDGIPMRKVAAAETGWMGHLPRF